MDLSQIPPEKLLDYKLKYTAALKEEYTSPAAMAPEVATMQTAEATLSNLLYRLQNNATTVEAARVELAVIGKMREIHGSIEATDWTAGIAALLGQ